MKINLDVEIKDFQGNSLTVEKHAITLADEAGASLMMVGGQMMPAKPADKFLAFKIAKKIADNAREIDLSKKEYDLLVKTVGQCASPLVFGRFLEAIGEDDPSSIED